MCGWVFLLTYVCPSASAHLVEPESTPTWEIDALRPFSRAHDRCPSLPILCVPNNLLLPSPPLSPPCLFVAMGALKYQAKYSSFCSQQIIKVWQYLYDILIAKGHYLEGWCKWSIHCSAQIIMLQSHMKAALLVVYGKVVQLYFLYSLMSHKIECYLLLVCCLSFLLVESSSQVPWVWDPEAVSWCFCA